jgi:hypothetical protein
MRKLSLIYKLLKLVLFNQLRSHISSERSRLLKEELSLPKPLLREELSSPNGLSNLTSRRTLLKQPVLLPTRRALVINPDLRQNVRD